MKSMVMPIGDHSINVNEITDIQYNKELDLIIIEWESGNDNNKIGFSMRVGRNAFGMKSFIKKVIDAINEKRTEEIEKYENILDILE